MSVMLFLALATLAPADATPTRLAVMPFKNLNADPQLDWLKLGVAETMISDLKSAHRDVVERDQLDKALAEIALQRSAQGDDAAALAGKLVGATHVVVGGFQRAGEQVRITARLVAVETGVVDTSAKVTGALTDVFALQDSVVGQLLKLDKVPVRPKPKNPKRTLDAYKAYALSLSTSSDAEKIEDLRRALDLDPDFHYALSDMRALESRLDRYARKGALVVDERTQKMLAVVDDVKATPQERNMQAVMAMNGLMSQFRYQPLLDVASRIASMSLPEGEPPMAGMPPMRAKEYASYYVFLSLMMLKKTDLALQAGERYVAQYSGGVFSQSIDLQMRGMIDQAHRHEDALKRSERELSELDLDEKNRGKPLTAVQKRSFAFRHCSVLTSCERWADAIDVCKQFAADYKDADDGDNLVKLAHFMTMRSWTELGRFDEAKNEANRMLDAWPSWARELSLDMQMRTWPQP